MSNNRGEPAPPAVPETLPDGVSCDHPGCLHHVSHPCEGCGRIAGRAPAVPEDEALPYEERIIDRLNAAMYPLYDETSPGQIKAALPILREYGEASVARSRQPSTAAESTRGPYTGPPVDFVREDFAARPSSTQGEDGAPTVSTVDPYESGLYNIGMAADLKTDVTLDWEEAAALRARLSANEEEVGRLNRLVEAEAGLRRLAGEDKAEAWAKVRELEARLASLDAAKDGREMREALKPFAAEADRRSWLNGLTTLEANEGYIGGSALTDRDLVRARAALERKEGE